MSSETIEACDEECSGMTLSRGFVVVDGVKFSWAQGGDVDNIRVAHPIFGNKEGPVCGPLEDSARQLARQILAEH